jgi:hypothetical protein
MWPSETPDKQEKPVSLLRKTGSSIRSFWRLSLAFGHNRLWAVKVDSERGCRNSLRIASFCFCQKAWTGILLEKPIVSQRFNYSKKTGVFVNLGAIFAKFDNDIGNPILVYYSRCTLRVQEVKKMVKKGLTVILMLAILLVFAAPAFSRWGPKTKGFGPIVLGHPWGDQSPRSQSYDYPTYYRSGSGAGFQDFIITETVNFAVHFYNKYVVKKTKDSQV